METVESGNAQVLPDSEKPSLKHALRVKLKGEGSMPVKKLRKELRKGFEGSKDEFRKEFESALAASSPSVQVDEDGVASYSKKRARKGEQADEAGKKIGEKIEEAAATSAKVTNNPDGITRLFVGNLSWKIDEKSLQKALAPNVVTHFKWLTDQESGKFYGSGFIEMATPDDAGRAVAMAGSDVLGRPVKITYSPTRPGDVWPPVAPGEEGDRSSSRPSAPVAMSDKPSGCRKLFAGNLDYEITDEKMYEFFGEAAEITAIRYLTHRDSGDFKGCAFLEFASTRDADVAAKKNGALLSDRPIRLDWTE
mmetsp:Transcript_41368/g.56386  ORF Transcript_41368/g.56386 Transcript_41368/m.56386 type:complete len:308 (-) Transcript_41368:121-1044(-)